MALWAHYIPCMFRRRTRWMHAPNRKEKGDKSRVEVGGSVLMTFWKDRKSTRVCTTKGGCAHSKASRPGRLCAQLIQSKIPQKEHPCYFSTALAPPPPPRPPPPPHHTHTSSHSRTVWIIHTNRYTLHRLFSSLKATGENPYCCGCGFFFSFYFILLNHR